MKTPESLAKSLGNYPLRRVIAGATLFKSLSAVSSNTRKCGNDFLKEHLRKAAEKT